MTDRNIELTRRKILAGIGAVGGAGAGTGLGTSALFSDEESFESNTITAGELDLKVDWEEHYSFPQVYGFEDPTVDDGTPLDVTRSQPSDTSDYTALPDPVSPLLWVHDDDRSVYMDNTAIDSYPDADDDGVQAAFGSGNIGDFCTDGADVPADLDPAGLRTDNEDTSADGEPAPLIDLNDVKPGDFGEITLSVHLCDNPGYLWLQGDLVEASENGIIGPEADSSDENGPSDETVTDLGQDDDIELLDEVQTTLWYDGDCDNVFEPGSSGGTSGQVADVVLVIDRSESMITNQDSEGNTRLSKAKAGAKNLVNALGANDQVSLVSFGTDPRLDEGLTTDHMSVINAIDNLSSGTGVLTNMEGGIEQGHEELLSGLNVPADNGNRVYSESGNARSSARKFVVFLGDGTPSEGTDVTDPSFNQNRNPSQEATNLKDDGAEVFSIAYGEDLEQDGVDTLKDIASDPANNPEDQYFFEANISEIESTFESIGGTVGSSGEEVIFRGTLRESLMELSNGHGMPLDADRSTEDRSCFQALQTNCIGFAWWVPADVDNRIQSDSVSFDLGFTAVQCRNSDGSYGT